MARKVHFVRIDNVFHSTNVTVRSISPMTIIPVGTPPIGSSSNLFVIEFNPSKVIRNSRLRNKNVLRFNKSSVTTEPYLLKLISDEFGGSIESAQLWLDSPNPAFGGKSPSYYVEKGRIDVVKNLIEAISSGQPY